MAARSSAATTDSAQRVLVITRVFDAPRDLVFKAWSEPERLVQWFGPKGFTSTVVGSMDPRPGGAYRFHMRGPGGSDHWVQGVYREIVEPERIVCTYVWTDADGIPTRPENAIDVDLRGGRTEDKTHTASGGVRIGYCARCARGGLDQLAGAPHRIPGESAPARQDSLKT